MTPSTIHDTVLLPLMEYVVRFFYHIISRQWISPKLLIAVKKLMVVIYIMFPHCSSPFILTALS